MRVTPRTSVSAAVLRFAAGAVLVSVVNFPLAAAAPGPIELLPRWQQGEQQRLDVTKDLQILNGQTTLHASSNRAFVELTVLDVGRGGSVVRWTWGRTTIGGPATGATELASAVANLLEGVPYEVVVDPSGRVTGIRNWPEVRHRADAALTMLIERLRLLGLPPHVGAKLTQVSADTLASPDRTLGHLLREIGVYHSAYGRAYAIGAPHQEPATVANPFGGAPLAGLKQFTLRRLDRDARRAVVAWHHGIDRAALAAFTVQALGQLHIGPVPPSAAAENLSLTDAAELVLDPASGWPESVRYTRTLATGERRRVETFTILQLR